VIALDGLLSMIRLIAATDASRGIATDKGIPWKLPGDAAYFENQTSTGLIVMGWATYNEFSVPLHGRDNYVLTGDQTRLRGGFHPIATLADLTQSHPDEDVWVIGGAFVYAETIDRADELLITQVLEDFHCTKFFPDYATTFTRFEQSKDQEENGVQYRFEKWRRSAGSTVRTARTVPPGHQ
jgi:dihydrofolate reductase